MSDFEKKLAEELAKQSIEKLAAPAVLPLQAVGEAIAGHIKSWRWVHQGRFLNKKSDAEIDQMIKNTIKSIEDKVELIQEDKLQAPPLQIYGPAIQALSYSIDDVHLREMFAKLLASSMDSDVAPDLHPAYVEILKQMNSNEALIFKFMSKSRNYWFASGNKNFLSTSVCGIGRHHIENASRDNKLLKLIGGGDVLSCVDNLTRLNLVKQVQYLAVLSDRKGGGSDYLLEKKILGYLEDEGHGYPLLRPTYFGYRFIRTCVPDADLDIGERW